MGGGLKSPTLVWESNIVELAGSDETVYMTAYCRHLMLLNPATSVARVCVNLNGDTATCVGTVADYENQVVLEPGERIMLEDFLVGTFGVASDGVATLYWASTRGKVTGATP